MPPSLSRADLVPLSYDELGRILDALTVAVRRYLQASGRHVDAVAPILRSGAVTAMHLASRLDIVPMLPLQFKHRERHVERMFEPPILPLPERPTILICDTNTVSGEIARHAARRLASRYPRATLLFASAVLDAGVGALDGVEAIFSGRLGNESRSLSVDEARARGITNDVYVFPWEDADDQWQQIALAAARKE